MSTSGGDSRVSNVRRWRQRRDARLVTPPVYVVAFYMAPGIVIITIWAALATIPGFADGAWLAAFTCILASAPFALGIGIGIFEKNWPFRYRLLVSAVNLAPVPIWLVLASLRL